MATTYNDDSPPHGKTRLIQKYTAIDFGPLNTYRESHISNFRGGSYRLTTPIAGGGVMLYRLYGGGAAVEAGHYWTVEPRQGNTGFQLDYAMVPNWGSTLSDTTEVFAPQGIMLYEGHAAPQKAHTGSRDFGGGGWQVLIPLPVVEPLLRAQQAMKEGKGHSEVEKHLSRQ